MIVSAADTLTLADGTPHPTGYWAEEVAASHRVFREAGVDVDIATPGGATPTVDPISLDAAGGVSDTDAKDLRAYLDGLGEELTKPLVLADVSAGDYDAVYLPGGHGPMVDLAYDSDLGRLLVDADGRGQVVAALCHGPAGLLSAAGPDGSSLFAGRRMTVFTDSEERNGGLGDGVPYFVEAVLRERGATIEPGPDFSSTVVVDGNLVTGQNPQSSVQTAERVLSVLQARPRA